MSTESIGIYHYGTRNSSNALEDPPCNLLPISNSTVPLAANWENIPETLLLNGSIGIILYLVFLFLTHVAWNRSLSGDDNMNQGLISYLYGYRDPEHWYVIPRMEFLARSAKHHNHDSNTISLYVPPKLPLANPIELFSFDENDSKSIEENSVSQTKKGSKVIKSSSKSKKNAQTLAKNANSNEKQVKLKIKSLTHDSTQSSSSTINTIKSAKTAEDKSTNGNSVRNPDNSKQLKEPGKPDPSPLEQSFFYPSILTAEQLQASSLSRKLNRFFSMFFKVTDADIIYAKGIDAYEYLLFQRHLILIMFITNIFCLGIILPLHWFSNTIDLDQNALYATSFQRTTIKNMSGSSIYHWAHIASSICIVVFAIFVMNSYKESTMLKSDTQLARRTLLIGNIPVEQRVRTKIEKIFQSYFSRSKVEAIQFVYDIARLERYQMQLATTTVAKEYCLYRKRKYNEDIAVKPTDVNEGQYCNGNCRLCSFFYVCCCYWPTESRQIGSKFYDEKEKYYRDKIHSTLRTLIKNPSEYAFVTFRSYKQAKRVMEELSKLKSEIMNEKYSNILSGSRKRPTKASYDVEAAATNPSQTTKTNQANDPLDPKNNPHVRSIRSPIIKKRKKQVSKEANGQEAPEPDSKSKRILDSPLAWSVRYAPHPDNVEYYDLLNMTTTSRYTTVLLHILMILIFIFITTPNVLLSILERWSVLQPEKTKQLTGFQAMIINYLSILLQVITTALLPSLVTLISKQIPYEDTSSKNHSMMWKVYLFLVLMVIVMPSVGMSSAQALLSSEINPKCLFPTDNGAYFINYVVSSIFLSTILELIKPIDIVSYYFILCTGRSFADFEGGRQYIEREFSVSMQHTGVLLIFSTVMTYAISCPLIAPAGLLYLIVKHAVDHYNLFYTYFTKKVDQNQQNAIEIFVRIALVLMLFQTTLALSINTGTSYIALIMQVVFFITLAVFMFNCFFDCTSKAMMTSKRSHHQREFCACFYLPRVIQDLIRSEVIPDDCISRKL